MQLEGAGALVAGGASGLGAATARALAERGARVAVVDLNEENATARATEIGGGAIAARADVTNEEDVGGGGGGRARGLGGPRGGAVERAVEELGGLRLAVSCAGIGWAERTVGKNGPAQLHPFETVVRVNLIGTFNVLRFTAAAMAAGEPDENGERGCVVMTASIAAFDGQAGRAAYAASKGGIVSLTLPAARDLARQGIRVCTIAPGTFDTPLLAALPEP